MSDLSDHPFSPENVRRELDIQEPKARKKMHIIEQAGRALYGEHWMPPLADELDVSPRSLRRIVAGKEMPDGLRQDLIALCRTRRATLIVIIGGLIADA